MNTFRGGLVLAAMAAALAIAGGQPAQAQDCTIKSGSI